VYLTHSISIKFLFPIQPISIMSMTPEEKIEYDKVISSLEPEDKAYLRMEYQVKHTSNKLNIPPWVVREYYDLKQHKRTEVFIGLTLAAAGAVLGYLTYLHGEMKEQDRLDQQYHHSSPDEPELSPLESSVTPE